MGDKVVEPHRGAERRRVGRARHRRVPDVAHRGRRLRRGVRLAGGHQGRVRRRRSRHARGEQRRRGRGGLRVGAVRVAQGLRARRVLRRALPHLAAPHRDAGHRRHARQLRLDRRARLLRPAAPPEAGRGVAGAGVPAGDPPGHGRRGREGRGGVRLLQRRHRRVPVPGRRVLLPRDEHPAPGRAPRHRAGVGHRPGARADPGRVGREAELQPGRHRAARPRHRGPRQRREPGRWQVPAVTRAHHHARAAAGLRHPLGRWLRVRRRGQPVLRQPHRQAHRVGLRPAHGHRPHAARPQGVPHRGRRHHHPGRYRHPRPPRLRRGQALHQVGRGHPRPHRRRLGSGRPRDRRRRGAEGAARGRRRGQRSSLPRGPVGPRHPGGRRLRGRRRGGTPPPPLGLVGLRRRRGRCGHRHRPDAGHHREGLRRRSASPSRRAPPSACSRP